MIRGRIRYVPPSVLEEIMSIKQEDQIFKDADAFKKMREYSKVGREVKRMRDRLFLKDVFNK